MKKSTSAAIAIGALLCVAAVVFIRQFGNPDPTDEGGSQGAALSVDDQGVVDALQKSVPVNYKAGDGGRVTLLAVRSPQMNDELVGQLVKLTALRELQLVECVLGVEGIRAIASLPELESLPQLMMDPNLDYARVDRRWGPQPWIIPLTEPLRPEGWSVPLVLWESELADQIPADMRLGAAARN